jgi:hypothetical protein
VTRTGSEVDRVTGEAKPSGTKVRLPGTQVWRMGTVPEGLTSLVSRETTLPERETIVPVRETFVVSRQSTAPERKTSEVMRPGTKERRTGIVPRRITSEGASLSSDPERISTLPVYQTLRGSHVTFKGDRPGRMPVPAGMERWRVTGDPGRLSKEERRETTEGEGLGIMGSLRVLLPMWRAMPISSLDDYGRHARCSRDASPPDDAALGAVILAAPPRSEWFPLFCYPTITSPKEGRRPSGMSVALANDSRGG